MTSDEALQPGPVVLTSPTGSGKSTEVPRWCEGKVVVVEPRRIACRSLAARVAQLEGTELGSSVGYVVRDGRRMNGSSRIVFATPGIVQRDKALLSSADTLILDQFHERNLEVDLLLALALGAGRKRLVVMSATLDAERIAAHVAGTHLQADARTFPVDIRYVTGQGAMPDANDLPARVRQMLRAAARTPVMCWSSCLAKPRSTGARRHCMPSTWWRSTAASRSTNNAAQLSGD